MTTPIGWWLATVYALSAPAEAPLRTYLQSPAAKQPTASAIGFARLEGRVGFSVTEIDSGLGFDGKTIQSIIGEARKHGCKTIMLDIESGGGLVNEGVKIAEQIMEAQRSGITVVAWYGEAFSAASWIPISAKSAVAKPTGTCGGSVIMQTDASGKPTAVDAKMASHTIAKIKNAASASGRPHAFVDAIFVQDAELWIGEDGTLRAAKSKETDRCLDSRSTVLNMPAADAKACGFASGIAETREEAAKLAGLTASNWVDLTQVAVARSKKVAADEQRWNALLVAATNNLPNLVRKAQEAIEVSLDIARRDEMGLFLEKSDIQQAQRVRASLKDEASRYFSSTSGDSSLDDSLYLGPYATVTAQVKLVRDRVRGDVARICDLLAKRTVSKAEEAQETLEQMQSFLSDLFGEG